jgi:ribulose-5-phosphate 4-epimerase/fuculose-1-phosphate aldolase
MSRSKVTDLRKAYPELAPDKDYPPLKFKSLKGKVSAAEWEARVKGLLTMTQTAMRFDKVATHDYEGVVLEMGERKRLIANLGDAEVMLLRNHGLLAAGRTVAQAFNNIYRLERACRTQLMAMGGADEIVLPPREVIEKTWHMYRPGTRRPYGLLEWPAMRRLADRLDPSYKI